MGIWWWFAGRSRVSGDWGGKEIENVEEKGGTEEMGDIGTVQLMPKRGAFQIRLFPPNSNLDFLPNKS